MCLKRTKLGVSLRFEGLRFFWEERNRFCYRFEVFFYVIIFGGLFVFIRYVSSREVGWEER